MHNRKNEINAAKTDLVNPQNNLFYLANSNRPSFQLLKLVYDYLSSTLQQSNPLDNSHQHLYALMRQIYTHAFQLAVQYEKSRAEYVIDSDLYDTKKAYAEHHAKQQRLHELNVTQYRISIRTLNDDIAMLDQGIAALDHVNDVKALRELDAYDHLLEVVENRFDFASKAMPKLGLFNHVFCHMPQSYKAAFNQMEEVERIQGVLQSSSFEDARAMMVQLMVEQKQEKEDKLNALKSQPPILDDQYQHGYIKIEARIRSDENEYYAAISHQLMLDLIRLSFVIKRLSGHKAGNQPAHHLLREFKLVFEDFAPTFYCTEPGRYYYEGYLDHALSISDKAVIDSVVEGRASVEEIRQVISGYDRGLPAYRF